MKMTYCHMGFLAVSVSLVVGQASLAIDPGRDANIRVRLQPYVSAPIRSGPCPSGEAEPEMQREDGVEIAGQVIKRDDYEQLRRSGYIPMRREMTDQEFASALKPEFRKRLPTPSGLAVHVRTKFANYEPFLYWGFRKRGSDGVVNRAEATFEGFFAEDGTRRPQYLGMSSPPAVAMMRWGGTYWNTGDAKWARAVRDTFRPFYRHNRPPLGKVRNAKARGMWHVLGAGARVPTIIEAYAYVSASREWAAPDHVVFHKAMLERGRYLRYTTVPIGPWVSYNPFCYGNWILYQLEGLLAIAAHFPEFSEADEWLDHATQGIGRHADWVIMPDSGFDEYAYSYASRVAGQFAYCYNTFRKHGLPFPPRFAQNVSRLHELFLKLEIPGGHRAPFGDTHRGGDSGVSACRWAALAFLDPRFKRRAGTFPDDYLSAGARVLHPDAPAQAVEDLRRLTPQPPAATTHILPEPGWAVMRSAWSNDASTVAITYRGSDRVFHSGWEMLGLNIWGRGEPLMTKLLGLKSYTSGFPDGYCRTPLQANHVIVKGESLQRVAGSLRNWYTAPEVDYLHADHQGWAHGDVRARRRVLFLKPDWVVVIDDIEGKGPAELLWQAHTDDVQAEVTSGRATLVRKGVRATVTSLGRAMQTVELPVAGMDKSVFLLAVDAAGPLPIRFVTCIHVGDSTAKATPESQAIALGDMEGVDGIILGGRSGPRHTVTWEALQSKEGRFVTWQGPRGTRFFAGDGNPSAALARQLREPAEATLWNGRALLVSATRPTPATPTETILPSAVDAFAYHGRPEMTPVGTAGRVVWHTKLPARHSVLYRRASETTWHRQFQPGLHRTAWVLIPDLACGTDYQLKVVSEFASARVARSPLFRRKAPAAWDM